MTPDNYQSLMLPQNSQVGWGVRNRLFSHSLMGVGLTIAAWAGWSTEPAIAQSDGSMQLTQMPARARAMSNMALMYVNPVAGDDAVGDGGERTPFKTITQALKAAQPNTVIVLIPGTYSEQTGEVFPLKLKAGVTVQGDTRSHGKNIVIQGGGAYLSPTFASQNITILGVHQAGLAGVTVTNPNPRGYGLWIESASPVILENTFTGNTHDGISVVGSSAPVVRGNYFYANGANGITIYGNSRPEVRENLFIKTGFGINIAQDAAPTIIGNRIVQNQDGIVVQANAQPMIRGNLIEQNLRDGVVAIAQARPDLGNSNDPGANIFSNNGRFDINSSASTQEISAFGNQLSSSRISGRIDLVGSDNVASVAPAPAPISTATQPITDFQQNKTIRPQVQSQPENKTIRPLEVKVEPFRPTSPAPAIATAPTTPALPAVKPAFPALDIVPKPIPTAKPTVAVKPAAVSIPVKAVAVAPTPAVEVPVETPVEVAVPATAVLAANPSPTLTTPQPVTAQPVAIPIDVPPPEVSRPVIEPTQATSNRSATTNAITGSAIEIDVPPPETTLAIASPPSVALATPAIATAPPQTSTPSKASASAPSLTAAAFPVPTELQQPAKPSSQVATQSSSALRSQPISAYSFRTRRPAQPAASRSPHFAASSNSRPPAKQITLPPIPKPGANAIAIPVPPPESSRTTSLNRVAARPSRTPQLPVLPPKPAAAQATAPVVKPVVRPVVALAAQPTSIEIPVPAPETSAVVSTVPPAPTEVAAIAAIPQPSSAIPQPSHPMTSGDILPVPGADIPVGVGGGNLPSVLVARNPLDSTNSLPSPSQTVGLGSRYRVVVQVESEDEQAEVTAIAPNAFRTLSNGRMVIQVGSFSNRDNADKMMATLSSQGLKAAIEPLN